MSLRAEMAPPGETSSRGNLEVGAIILVEIATAPAEPGPCDDMR